MQQFKIYIYFNNIITPIKIFLFQYVKCILQNIYHYNNYYMLQWNFVSPIKNCRLDKTPLP